jgi:tripartite-type tricarboxylate transporter receptor subunit TctC
VPYPPGAPDDTIARLLANKLAETGDRIYVENLPGATGAIGTSAVAKAAADGCTLLIANQNFVIQPSVNPKVSYDVTGGFTPITLVATAPETILVNPGVPARSFGELVALLKANPGKYNYASPGYGSSPHLASERLFRTTLGLDVVHVPFQGGPPAIKSTLGGHTQILHLTLPIVAPLATKGSLRMLAVAATKRAAQFPNVPTLAEAGYPGLEVGYWNAILAPSGTPKRTVDALNARIVKALSSAEVAGRIRELGFQLGTTSPKAAATHIQAELARWSTIARQAKVKID